ncbi:hypothetical protein AAG906_012667 [Vitis piasezkii]
MHGESYTDFMMSKLVSVIGDVCKSNLGMDATSATEIAKAVDVIVNSAANTILDERYDVALNTNTKGPSRLVSFAKKYKKPSLSVHVSTALLHWREHSRGESHLSELFNILPCTGRRC